jgi:hypothetical protein
MPVDDGRLCYCESTVPQILSFDLMEIKVKYVINIDICLLYKDNNKD